MSANVREDFMAILRQEDGPEKALALRKMAFAAMHGRARLADAENFFQHSRALSQRLCGKGCPDVLECMCAQAQLAALDNRVDAALELIEQAREIVNDAYASECAHQTTQEQSDDDPPADGTPTAPDHSVPQRPLAPALPWARPCQQWRVFIMLMHAEVEIKMIAGKFRSALRTCSEAFNALRADGLRPSDVCPLLSDTVQLFEHLGDLERWSQAALTTSKLHDLAYGEFDRRSAHATVECGRALLAVGRQRDRIEFAFRCATKGFDECACAESDARDSGTELTDAGHDSTRYSIVEALYGLACLEWDIHESEEEASHLLELCLHANFDDFTGRPTRSEILSLLAVTRAASDPEEAARASARAMSHASFAASPRVRAVTLQRCARALTVRGCFSEAAELLCAAVRDADAYYPRYSRVLLPLLNDTAESLFQMGRFDEEIVLRRRVVALARVVYGGDKKSVEPAAALYALAGAQHLIDVHGMRETLEQAVVQFRDAHSTTHPCVVEGERVLACMGEHSDTLCSVDASEARRVAVQAVVAAHSAGTWQEHVFGVLEGVGPRLRVRHAVPCDCANPICMRDQPPPNEFVLCEMCERVRYCSKKCRLMNTSLHAPECFSKDKSVI